MFAEINGAEIYYEVLGADTDPAIMALHGGPGIGDHRKPKRAFEPLTDNYRLVVYDHRGCGRSSRTRPYSNEQYAKDAEGLRRHLDLDTIVLIGGSYGGFITQEYAAKYSDHLAGIILRDTAPTHKYDERAREIACERLPEVRSRDLDIPEITADELAQVMDGNVPSDEAFERIFHGMLPLYAPSLDDFDADAARESIRDTTFDHETHNVMFSEEFADMDYTDVLPTIDVPALVTVGRNDWITPPEAAEELDELLPDSQLVVFESSGHSPHLDQQEAYLRRVRSFLEEIDF